MKEKNLLDFEYEAFSELGVKKLLGLPLELSMQVDIRIGEESAGVVVIPWQSDIFSADERSISTDIVIFTSVEGNRVRVRGWQRTMKLIAHHRREDGEIQGAVSELEPIESLLLQLQSPKPATDGVPTCSAHSRHALLPGAGVEGTADLQRNQAMVLVGPVAARFPSVNASDEECRRFAIVTLQALPEAMVAPLFGRQGAFLWITKFADGVIVAEASSMAVEPWIAEQLWRKPGPSEIAVGLAFAEVPSNRAGDYDEVDFWKGIVAIKESTSVQ